MRSAAGSVLNAQAKAQAKERLVLMGTMLVATVLVFVLVVVVALSMYRVGDATMLPVGLPLTFAVGDYFLSPHNFITLAPLPADVGVPLPRL